MFILQEVTKTIYSLLQSQRMDDHIMRRYFSYKRTVLHGVDVLWTYFLSVSTTSPEAPKLKQLFASAADILWKIGEDGRVIEEFIRLGLKAKAAASEAMDAENNLGEIPEEFMDPIQVQFLLFLRSKGLSQQTKRNYTSVDVKSMGSQVMIPLACMAAPGLKKVLVKKSRC